MNLASIIAKKIASATNDLLDVKLVEDSIRSNADDLVAKHGLIDEAGKENVSKVNYVLEKVEELVDQKTITDNDLVDPDASLLLDIEEKIISHNPTIETALRKNAYFKTEGFKTADIDETDQALVDFIKYRLSSAARDSRLIDKKILEQKATKFAKVLKATPEYSIAKAFSPPDKINYNQTIPPVENIDEALTDFLADSVVQEPVFRGVKSGVYSEYDTRFFTPDEIGVHVGSEGQANYFGITGIFGSRAQHALPISTVVSEMAEPVARRPSYYDSMEMDEAALMDFVAESPVFKNKTYSREDASLLYDMYNDARKFVIKSGRVSEKQIKEYLLDEGATALEARLVVDALLNQKDRNPVVIYKGYVNLKNPLDLNMQDGLWKGAEFFNVENAGVGHRRRIDALVDAIAEQADEDPDVIMEQKDFVDLYNMIKNLELTTMSVNAADRPDFISELRLSFKTAEVNHAIRKWIESYGFDGIHYYNDFEPSFPEETASSYIIFKPEQFKSVFAKRFDQEDPRFGANKGGLIGSFFENFMARNEEIKQADTQRVVKKGDTLTQIAKETGVTVEELQQFNKLQDANQIQVGQTLRIKPPVEKNQVLANVGSFLNPFAGDKTEKDYDSGVVNEVRKAAKKAIAAGRMNIDYEDYQGADVRGQASDPEKREKTSFMRRMLTGQANPTEQAAFSVGGATLVVEGDKVYATDVYDFSRIPRERVKDAYSAIRYIVGELPGNEFKSKIYLGTATDLGIRKGKAEGGEVDDPSMYRRDGSRKSERGFLGPIINKATNKTMTELSIDIPFDGKEVQIPTMVPTLTAEEIKILQSQDWEGKAKDLPRSIVTKAVEHAVKRMSEGLNPFYQDGEERETKAKGGKVSKKDMACNKPKRTPQHPKKSHVVKACEGGKEKVIRFGEQGAETAGKPKAGESERMKKKRKSFKARHARNIKKGKMSAAYWADKVKW